MGNNTWWFVYDSKTKTRRWKFHREEIEITSVDCSMSVDEKNTMDLVMHGNKVRARAELEWKTEEEEALRMRDGRI